MTWNSASLPEVRAGCRSSARPDRSCRKNWLFAGSDKAAERHAIFYTLIETCHRHQVNTWLYLKDVLKSVSTHPASQIAELFPHRWKVRHPEAHLAPLDRR